MEETKRKEEQPSQTASKQPEKKPSQKPEKYSYDELNKIASELLQQNRQLQTQLQNAQGIIAGLQTQNMFAYLDSLFKVIQNSVLFDEKFVNDCGQKIEGIIELLSDMMPNDRTNGEQTDGDSEEA